MLTLTLFYITEGIMALYPDSVFNHFNYWHQSGALDVAIQTNYLEALRFYFASTTIEYPIYHYFIIDGVNLCFRLR